MIKNFSPKEINYLIGLCNQKSLYTEKIRNYRSCKDRYVTALKLIDRDSMSTSQLANYDSLLKKLQ